MEQHEKIKRLIGLLSILPGVGPRSAERISFYILNSPNEYAKELSEAIKDVKNGLFKCRICGNFTYNEDGICDICKDNNRDKSTICIVEKVKDLWNIERLKIYKGVYHILGGLISPIDGIGPEDLNIDSLKKRIEKNNVKEIILAINPTAEGETTAFYLAKILSSYNVKITKLSAGLPVGGEIDFTDGVTLTRSFLERKEFKPEPEK